jgi:hypothetical protein
MRNDGVTVVQTQKGRRNANTVELVNVGGVMFWRRRREERVANEMVRETGISASRRALEPCM